MAQALPIEAYRFLPVQEAVSPVKGGFFVHYVDAWWLVHPEHGLAFFNPRNARTGRRRMHGLGSPQCNTDERISRKVGQDCAPWPDPEVRQLASVWVPVDISDYRQ
jgi:hypothetical protein